MKKVLSAVSAAILIFSAPGAGAGSVAGFGGSTEITQILNNIQLVESYIQQVQSYATQIQQWQMQIQQYQNMVQNTLALPSQIWGNVQNDLMGLANVVRQGQALAYSASNIGTQFTNTFKGFQYPAGFNHKTSYTQWNKTTMDTLKGALEAAGLQSQQFATEESVLTQLRGMSSSATGQVQAIQAGSQIAEQQVQQLQKLRQLMMTQMTAQNTYLAAQENKEATRTAAREDAIGYQNPATTYQRFVGGSR
jgi:type IV secretion system protein TrbJ